MSAMGWGIGGGAAMLAGAGLGYLGERQGAKAMQREADRQAAEQAALNEAHQRALVAELGRFDPAEQANLATAGVLQRRAAATPSLQAGGKALGLSRASVARAGAPLYARQALAAQGQAANVEGQRANVRMSQLGSHLAGLDESKRQAAALYGQQLQAAGSKGAGLRMLGQGLGAAGQMALMYGMSQPAQGETRFAENKPIDGEYRQVAKPTAAEANAAAHQETWGGFNAQPDITSGPLVDTSAALAAQPSFTPINVGNEITVPLSPPVPPPVSNPSGEGMFNPAARSDRRLAALGRKAAIDPVTNTALQGYEFGVPGRAGIPGSWALHNPRLGVIY